MAIQCKILIVVVHLLKIPTLYALWMILHSIIEFSSCLTTNKCLIRTVDSSWTAWPPPNFVIMSLTVVRSFLHVLRHLSKFNCWLNDNLSNLLSCLYLYCLYIRLFQSLYIYKSAHVVEIFTSLHLESVARTAITWIVRRPVYQIGKQRY